MADTLKIDYEYHVTVEQIKRYQKIPLLDRLRWLEEMCVLTKMVQAAPHSKKGRKSLGKRRAAR